MRNLYIIGASHFARELEFYLQTDPRTGNEWQVKGFLYYIEGTSPLDIYPSDLKILGDWRNFEFAENDLAIIGFGECASRRRVFEHLSGKVELLTYIHPDATVGNFTSVGKGSIILQQAIITVNCKIGNGVLVQPHTTIGHDCQIGDFSIICPGVRFGGAVKVGNDSYLATNSTIIPKVSLAANSILGAGSVLISNVRKPGTYFGCPATLLFRDSQK